MAGYTVNIPVQPGWDATFRSRDSIVGRDLSNRATRVQLAAKAQVRVYRGAKPGEDPAKRPIPGLLKRDITKNWLNTGNPDNLAISVGSTLPYAELIHEGSPPHVILPRRAQVLRFVGSDGRVHFSKMVNHPGFPADHYLTDNLPLAVQ